jgi:hypothetical protein
MQFFKEVIMVWMHPRVKQQRIIKYVEKIKNKNKNPEPCDFGRQAMFGKRVGWNCRKFW